MGVCCLCATAIEPGARFTAALAETPAGFERRDHCLSCWPTADQAPLLAFWQTMMPHAEQKKKLFVDDSVLCELFERLSGVEEPAKLNFRFVLGLILMRKRLLAYEGSKQADGREVWMLKPRGRQEFLEMTNPHLDESQVRDVSQQLGEILQQEL